MKSRNLNKNITLDRILRKILNFEFFLLILLISKFSNFRKKIRTYRDI